MNILHGRGNITKTSVARAKRHDHSVYLHHEIGAKNSILGIFTYSLIMKI